MKLKWQINDEKPIIKELDNFDLAEIKLCLMPSEVIVEVKHGKWKPEKTGFGFYCNKCKMYSYWATNFCPNCGADMRGENE